MSFASEPSSLSETEINYQEQMSLNEFVNIDSKLFSLAEIEQLLSSTSHYHKLYALRVISSFIGKNGVKAFEIVFNKDYSRVPQLMEIQPNRQDFVKQMIEIWVKIFRAAFSDENKMVCTQNIEFLQKLRGDLECPEPCNFYLSEFFKDEILESPSLLLHICKNLASQISTN